MALLVVMVAPTLFAAVTSLLWWRASVEWQRVARGWEGTSNAWNEVAQDVFDTNRMTRDLLTRLDGGQDVRDELVAREMQVQELQDRIVELKSALEGGRGAPVSFGGGAG